MEIIALKVIILVVSLYGVVDAGDEEECTDWLDDKWHIVVFGPKKEKLVNCKRLVNKYPHLCQKEHGEKGGRCCLSCSKRDFSCVDNTQVQFTVNNVTMACRRYVRQRPGRCNHRHVKEHCCASCRKNKGRCRDSRSYIANLRIQVGKREIMCYNCKCADIRAEGKRFSRKACKTSSRVKEHCCKLCKR